MSTAIQFDANLGYASDTHPRKHKENDRYRVAAQHLSYDPLGFDDWASYYRQPISGGMASSTLATARS